MKLLIALPVAALLSSCVTDGNETWHKVPEAGSVETLLGADPNPGFTAPSYEVAEKPLTRDGKPAQILISAKFVELSTKEFRKHDVFGDTAFQIKMRKLSQMKGADLMTAPSIVTHSGQRAKIEVIREMKLKGAAFDEALNLGVMLDVEPAILTNGRIHLSGKSTVREIDSPEVAFENNTAIAVQSSDTYFDATMKPGETALMIFRDHGTPGQRVVFITANVIGTSGQPAKLAR